MEYIAQSVGELYNAEQLVRLTGHVRHRLSEDVGCVASGDVKYPGAVYEVRAHGSVRGVGRTSPCSIIICICL